MDIIVNENNINLVIRVDVKKKVRLLHFSPFPFQPGLVSAEEQKRYSLVEVQCSGENHVENHGTKHSGTLPGNRLVYKTHRDYRTAQGRKLEIEMEDDGFIVLSHLQFYEGIPIVRSWTEVRNESAAVKGLEYVSSFALSGISKEGLLPWDEKSRVHIPHHTWYGEAQWCQYMLPELGLSKVMDYSFKKLVCTNTGSWSTSQFLPMGCYENIECGSVLFWQIEHNGSWHWEISDKGQQLYLLLSGPTEHENAWWKRLEPGETFTSVPVAVGIISGNFEEAMQELTKYRRVLRRPNRDNQTLPVIFNDYMNCNFGDPTTEKLLPLIDAAAEVGCEYFCIDCGWYSDGEWWDRVGEWLPSKRRFPGGIKEPLDYIRAKGMVPGLWLELEVMGINCPLASQVPDDWFFTRHGKRVITHDRYQLDFRNPEVRKHADEVIRRLVEDYGVGYIKMDYNLNAGSGTENNADSFGDGLLSHNRAYLDWLDGVFRKYPELVIENCSSGGMRMDYAMLSRHSIQSSSDQTDYRKTAVIAAACATGVTPEQCAVWSYPLREGDIEEVVFNMVNALLMRIHLSGHLAEISPERLAMVREAIDYYKSIRLKLKDGLPIWPLGLPTFQDPWVSWGLRCGSTTYLAVWRLEGSRETCRLPLTHLKGKEAAVRCGYPASLGCDLEWHQSNGELTIVLPKTNMARIIEIEEK